MKTYLVWDGAVHDRQAVTAESPLAAAQKYVDDDYRTATSNDVLALDGSTFARLSVWSDEDTCELIACVIADGRGGVREVCEAPHA
jgi:hypothetical protein